MNAEAPVVNIDARRSKAAVGATLSNLCVVNFSPLKPGGVMRARLSLLRDVKLVKPAAPSCSSRGGGEGGGGCKVRRELEVRRVINE